ncbi:GNAT family N-acetyltransferase [Anaerocolumna jejuensis]|uniref:GNAT family N-acetyltransferase n=1 Tax=Anaerocolumna jejuensis TaxID=259063 RepID=UPI003F7C55E1
MAYMDELILIKPNKEWEALIEDYKREHFEKGENELHGSALLDKLPFEKWLELLENNASEETVSPDWVVSSTFLAVRKWDNRIVGMLDIRHTLNEFLKNYGGHIGYGVRPRERGKGYAVQILQLGLAYCKTIGLEKVMLACYKDNAASSKTIVKCGGKLEREFVHSDDKKVQVFWIMV